MALTIALAGNPNSGKTTLFNALTGSNQFVGNWPGVTVEKKEGKLKFNKEVTITDLPGIYSLSPYTLEEVVSRNYLLGTSPDAILNIVDGTNLERNLYLTTQVLELGIPTVIAVNMADILQKTGQKVNINALSKALGVPVVEISALKGTGVREAADAAVAAAKSGKVQAVSHSFSKKAEEYISQVESVIDGSVEESRKRFYAIKLLERDDKIKDTMSKSFNVDSIINDFEAAFDDDSESIITNERYEYISSIIGKCITAKKSTSNLSVSDKIDRIVTNRILALPIFAVVMFIVYYVSVTTVGTYATDWANDGVFGDGWYLFGHGRAEYDDATAQYETAQAQIDAFIEAAGAEGIDTSAVTAEEPAEDAYSILAADAADVTTQVELTDDEGNVEEVLDVDADAFLAASEVAEPDPADYGWWVPGVPVIIESGLTAVGCADWLQSLVLDGIVAGVGAVLGFVPQMLVLFIFLAFLESCGYMARIAFIMDRIFRRFGLSGKSFIPMLIGTGCGVPGVMASRTIENERDRRMTIMTTTFIPCGAKLPIIALIAGALFNGAAWVAPSAYFVGVAAIVISGIILKKTNMFAGDPAPFVMELPAYHMPTVGNVLRSMWERGWSFIKKAGTIILLSTIFIWFVSNYGFTDSGFGMVDDLSDGLLANIGNIFAPLFAPLGWGDWKAAVAAIMGLVAKENVVGTFGILYGFAEVAEDGVEIWGELAGAYTPVAAYSFLVFNLLCAPCFAAIGAIKREMNSPKWTAFAIGYQTIFAYVISFCIYHIGNLFVYGSFGVGTIIAFLLIAALIYLMARPYKESRTLSAKLAVEK